MSIMLIMCMMPQMAFAEDGDDREVTAPEEEITAEAETSYETAEDTAEENPAEDEELQEEKQEVIQEEAPEASDETEDASQEEAEEAAAPEEQSEEAEERFVTNIKPDFSWYIDSLEEDEPETDGVLVLYKEGSVTSDALTSKEKEQIKTLSTSDSFGRDMAGFAKNGKDLAINTLPDQKRILEGALKSKFTIEDTYVIEKTGSGKKAKDTVIGLVSSNKYSDEELADILSESKDIEIAEPNYAVKIDSLGSGTGDPYAKYAWQNDAISRDVIADSLPAEQDEIVVAIIDTGVDYEHEDLEDMMWTNPGYKDLKGVHGYDFVYNDTNPMDEQGHGTHCAGIIAAQAMNDKGTDGVASKANVKIMALRFLDEEGSGMIDDALAAYCYIIRALDDGVNIKLVNNSWGGSGSSEIFEKLVDITGQKGALSFFASGNESIDNDYYQNSPTNVVSNYGVSINALNERLGLASYSCYGRKNTDICSPGTNIISSVSYNNYMPFIYDRESLSENTSYYGEFNADTVITDGKVTPSVGTDVNGESNEGYVKGFGESVIKQTLMPGSSGSSSLEFADGPYYNDDADSKALKWTISNPTEGDTYLLFFPYEKEEGVGILSSYENISYRTETDGIGLPGIYMFGDVGYNSADEEGTFTMDELILYMMDPEAELFLAAQDSSYNDIWRSSGSFQRSGKETKDLAAYGIGFLYYAASDADFTFYIDSIGVAKRTADEDDFGKYDIYSGTSMATPCAVGAAALLSAAYPEDDALSLKAHFLASARKTDELKDLCSTGGYIDFSGYDVSAPGPAILDASVDFAGETVTLTGKNFGTEAGSISYDRPLSDISVNVSAQDITWSDDEILISNAKDLIGTDATISLTSSSGKETQASFYLVKGENKYDITSITELPFILDDDFFFFFKKDADSDEETSGENMNAVESNLAYNTFGAVPVIGETSPTYAGQDGQYLDLMDPVPAEPDYDDDDYYDWASSKAVSSGSSDNASQESGVDEEFDPTTMYSALEPHGANLYTALKDTDEYKEWVKIESAIGSDTKLTVKPLSNPVAYGGLYYRMFMLSGSGRDIVILTSFDPKADYQKEWKILFDSTKDELPDGVTMDASRNYSNLAALNGKLYLIGGFCTSGDADEPYFNREVSSWDLNAKAPAWKACAELPEDLAGGTALAQNGRIYYTLGYDSSAVTSKKVYCFDGSEWTGMNSDLPEFVRSYGDNCSASIGIAADGIVFAGLSTDGGGDTFKYLTADGLDASERIVPLNYTLTGAPIEYMGMGTVFGSKQQFLYEVFDEEQFDYICYVSEIPAKSQGYSVITYSKSGLGSGKAQGIGTYIKGDKAKITITPTKTSFIKEIKVDGTKVSGKSTKAKTITVSATKNKHKISVSYGTYKISKATVKLSTKTYTYNGKAKKPSPTVKLNGTTLKKGTDYTVTYKSNKAIGKAKVTIKGKGSYTGSKTVTFTIKPAKVSGLTLTPSSKGFTAAFTKGSGSVKYKVAYRVKGTSSWKTVNVTKNTYTASSLKSGTTYQVRVRAYKTVSGKTYYGSWSAIEEVTAGR